MKKSLLTFLCILFFSSFGYCISDYLITLENDKTEYNLNESALFQINILTKKKNLNEIVLKASFPSMEMPVKLTRTGKKQYQYKTEKLTTGGEKTLIVQLYKKTYLHKIEILEKEKIRAPV